MTARPSRTTTAPPERRPTAPCHPIISRQIDRVICTLDAERRPLQGTLLRLQKRIVELAIPAWYPAEGGAR